MLRITLVTTCGLLFVLAMSGGNASAAGDPERGATLYRACAACHSLDPGRHKTGPALSKIWGRKAGTVEGFKRYSPALRNSEIVWGEDTLDRWIEKPASLIPGNRMTFRGLGKKQDRQDLVAYLKSVTAAGPAASRPGGRMAERPQLDLSKPVPGRRVTAIRYCEATYHVTTADGETHQVWEFNLRFKTDSSDNGPPKGMPALIRAGMMGDRASVVFSEPGEIGAFINKSC